MSTMGQAQGINQGQRTNLYANRAFMKRLSDYINDIFEEKEVKKSFDFDKFVNDENYRLDMIQTYGAIKKSFNILEALTRLPHF
jgi:4-alpha-glucanotransferase